VDLIHPGGWQQNVPCSAVYVSLKGVGKKLA